jgi:hypothetical protein
MRIEDLAARVGQKGLSERGGGIAQGQGALAHLAQSGLDQRKVDEHEVALKKRQGAQEDRSPRSELQQGE